VAGLRDELVAAVGQDLGLDLAAHVDAADTLQPADDGVVGDDGVFVLAAVRGAAHAPAALARRGRDVAPAALVLGVGSAAADGVGHAAMASAGRAQRPAPVRTAM